MSLSFWYSTVNSQQSTVNSQLLEFPSNDLFDSFSSSHFALTLRFVLSSLRLRQHVSAIRCQSIYLCTIQPHLSIHPGLSLPHTWTRTCAVTATLLAQKRHGLLNTKCTGCVFTLFYTVWNMCTTNRSDIVVSAKRYLVIMSQGRMCKAA